MALDYNKLVAEYLAEYHAIPIHRKNELTRHLICDYERGHHLLLETGWQGEEERIYRTVMHIDVVNDKILIQENITDRDIEAELIELGVRPQDIVLELVPPAYRAMAGLP